LLVAGTDRGICAVEMGDSDQILVAALIREYPAAQIHPDPEGLGDHVRTLVGHLRGQRIRLDLPLDLRITAFQRQVYDALRAIPYGATRSYKEVAGSMGRHKAARAVARACATNPVALIVPCHRVVREGGESGGYRWGPKIKEALLRKERETRQDDL
jgi:AraC family transcriptional regulator of adaptative response/methylated-DNA-[protein]-cysteine methyltransferase